MSFEENTSTTNQADTTAATNAPAVPLTKEQKIARIDEQIKRLQAKREDIVNDVVRVKAVKEVVIPEVGTVVTFLFGRKTANTVPVEKTGTVIAVKQAVKLETGKTAPAQIKVTFGEGFEADVAVIYPAQVTSIVSAVAEIVG